MSEYSYPAEVVREWHDRKERAACVGFDAMRLLLGLAPKNMSAAEVIVEVRKAGEAYLRNLDRKVTENVTPVQEEGSA